MTTRFVTTVWYRHAMDYHDDPYRVGAAAVLGKRPEDVSPDEAKRFKLAFFRALHARLGAPDREAFLKSVAREVHRGMAYD